MKILVLESSGNKHGSSNLLAEAFIRGARENGHEITEYDVLRADIRPCLGCNRCGMDGPWHCGLNTLIRTDADPDTVAGGPKMPHCSELWDAISRYIYTGLQGGSIMKGWMERENEMIACCSDGTRPVIFKIERIDYE